MSNSAAISFDQLPLEILHGIFHYLEIPDILRIRRENALVPSYRADRNLRHGGGTAQRERPTRKLREIRYTGVDLGVSLVFGRFLFIALSEEVRCYDLNLDAFDSNSGASIIYRSRSGTLTSFRCVSAIDVRGSSVCLRGPKRRNTDGFFSTTKLDTNLHSSIFSLNVSEHSEVTLDLLYQFKRDIFDIDVVDIGPRVIAIHGQVGPVIDTDWRLIALGRAHIHAAMWNTVGVGASLFTSPQSLTSNDKQTEWPSINELTPPTSISTSTHLLLAVSFYAQATGWSTFIQAFTLPHPDTRRSFTPASTPLSPSHSGIIHGIYLRDRVLLRDAVLDPATQDVLITIRVHAFEPSRPRSPLSKYGILRLGSTAHSTSPDRVGTVAFRLLGFLGQLSRTPFLHPSFNGTGRAFYTPERRIIAALEYDVPRDGGGGGDDEPEARVIEYPSILRFSTPCRLLDYDPYSGRICLQSAMAKYRVIEILDLAV
ncbi:hypothetical protein J3R83DRAFT_8008 [Lanmaoa asiatica]|nr:hypothetical protein J3R83DRAFT_8008 [Lanmaoa asiatica]